MAKDKELDELLELESHGAAMGGFYAETQQQYDKLKASILARLVAAPKAETGQ